MTKNISIPLFLILLLARGNIAPGSVVEEAENAEGSHNETEQNDNSHPSTDETTEAVIPENYEDEMWEDGEDRETRESFFARLEPHCTIIRATDKAYKKNRDKFLELTSKDAKLGEGAFGSVFKMQWEGNKIAMKKMRLGDNNVREIEVLKQLEGTAGVPQIKFCRVVEPFIYYGQSLLWKDMANTDAVEVLLEREIRTKLPLYRNLAQALTTLHEKNYVHNDIKPENLMAESDSVNEILLIDFGLAKRPDQFFRAGTPEFWSPELCRDQNHSANQKDDVWAMTLSILELELTYKNMYPEDHSPCTREWGCPNSCFEKLINQIKRELIFVSREDVSCGKKTYDQLWKMALKAFSFDPSKRLTASELVAELDAAIAACGDKHTPEVALSLYDSKKYTFGPEAAINRLNRSPFGSSPVLNKVNQNISPLPAKVVAGKLNLAKLELPSQKRFERKPVQIAKVQYQPLAKNNQVSKMAPKIGQNSLHGKAGKIDLNNTGVLGNNSSMDLLKKSAFGTSLMHQSPKQEKINLNSSQRIQTTSVNLNSSLTSNTSLKEKVQAKVQAVIAKKQPMAFGNSSPLNANRLKNEISIGKNQSLVTKKALTPVKKPELNPATGMVKNLAPSERPVVQPTFRNHVAMQANKTTNVMNKVKMPVASKNKFIEITNKNGVSHMI